MLDVAALTSGRNVPSARFRVRQYLPELRRRGIGVTELLPKVDKYADLPGILGGGRAKTYLPPAYWIWAAYRLATRVPGVVRSRQASVIWLEREFQPGLTTFEGMLRKPFVFDVDDAIWLKKPAGPQLAQYVGRRASAIIAGNSYIADWFSSVNTSVHIIPTAVDPSRFDLPVVYERGAHAPFIIGWTGTYVNFPHLYAIEKGLNHFLSTHDHTKLRIIADRPPVFSQISADKIDYIAWSPSNETAVLSTFSVGIMPLVDNAWTRGKCAYKMLQYMAASLPVVVSPVGMNLEVIEDLQGCGLTATRAAQWSEALDFYYHHDQPARAWGQKGREVILQKYQVSIIAEKLAAVFSSFASC